MVPAADRERGITPVEFRLVKIHMSFREFLVRPPRHSVLSALSSISAAQISSDASVQIIEPTISSAWDDICYLTNSG